MPTCETTGIPFEVSEAEREYCARFEVPLPRQCPAERLRSVLAFRNRPFLVNATCARTKRKIFSMVPPESGFTIYDVDVWESDVWDPRDYGREYDFRRPFFEQFAELLRAVPTPNLAVFRSTMENSDYTNGITGAKNCYLLFSSSYNEDCMFSICLRHCKNVIDSVYVHDSELCYDCDDLRNCYDVKFSEHCVNCSESMFLSNCQSCRSCYGCVNLQQREHCWYNEQLTPDEYVRRLRSLDLGSMTQLEQEREKFEELRERFPRKYYFGKSIEGSSGNYIANTKNCRGSFFVNDAEDCEHCIFLSTAKSAFVQAGFGNGTELIYNSVTAGDSAYDIRFCAECWSSVQSLEYCFSCLHGTSHAFGCVGLKHASYAVLNTEYSKDAYFDLVRRIKAQMKSNGEYGRFFPASLSPFYFNESDAGYYFPVDRDEALDRGYRWREPDSVNEAGLETVPDHIRDADDDVLETTFRCSLTGRPYKILRQELTYHRANGIPLPDVAPLERIKSRLGFFEISPLRASSCAQCRAAFETVYRANGPPLLCERCFLDSLE